jgi:hypothetical protein
MNPWVHIPQPRASLFTRTIGMRTQRQILTQLLRIGITPIDHSKREVVYFFYFFWFIGAVDKREFITLRIRTCHAPTLGSPARPVAQAREERGVLKLAKALFACACINLNSYVLKYIGVKIKLISIPFHSNTCRLRRIHMHPNKA